MRDMYEMTRTHWLLVTLIGVQLWTGGSLLQSTGPAVFGGVLGLFGALGSVLSLFERPHRDR